MFKKNVPVGKIYKSETDWGAVFTAIFWIVVVLAILGSLGN